MRVPLLVGVLAALATGSIAQPTHVVLDSDVVEDAVLGPCPAGWVERCALWSTREGAAPGLSTPAWAAASGPSAAYLAWVEAHGFTNAGFQKHVVVTAVSHGGAPLWETALTHPSNGFVEIFALHEEAGDVYVSASLVQPVTGYDTFVARLDGASGVPVWVHSRTTDPAGGYDKATSISIDQAGGRLYYGLRGYDQELVAVDLATGATAWVQDLGGVIGATVQVSWDDASGKVLAAWSDVTNGTRHASFAAFGADGSRQWKHAAPAAWGHLVDRSARSGAQWGVQVGSRVVGVDSDAGAVWHLDVKSAPLAMHWSYALQAWDGGWIVAGPAGTGSLTARVLPGGDVDRVATVAGLGFTGLAAGPGGQALVSGRDIQTSRPVLALTQAGAVAWSFTETSARQFAIGPPAWAGTEPVLGLAQEARYSYAGGWVVGLHGFDPAAPGPAPSAAVHCRAQAQGTVQAGCHAQAIGEALHVRARV